MPTVRDLTGQRFGRLTVVAPAGRAAGSRNAAWRCRCDCGGEVPAASGSKLRSGHTASCGCLMRERARDANLRHGHAKRADRAPSPEYKTWAGMLRRCRLPSEAAYRRYGARGIAVCDRWLSFDAFLQDMGPKPFPGAEIDRLDNARGYEPGNCRWATRQQQARNMTTNRTIDTPRGPMLLCEAAEAFGIGVRTLHTRLSRGWTGDRVFAPVGAA